MPRREPDPDWVTPEIKALQRKAARRIRAIQLQCKPCERCGNLPDVYLGFLDAQREPGQEFLTCPTYIIGVPGIPDQPCGTHSIGIAAWNWRGPMAPKAGV